MRIGFEVVGRGARGAVSAVSLAAALAVGSLAGCGGEPERAAAEGDSASSSGGPGSNGPAAGKVAAAPGRVLVVGTSLTAGLGLDPSEAYPAVLAAKVDSAGLPFEVVNAGVSGETSSGALRRIDWLLREPVDVLVLETGANDGLRGVPVTTLRANIQAIVDRVKAARPGARILLVQMEALPNLGPEYTRAFRSVYPELAQSNGLTLVPFLLEGVAGEASLNQPDGIHPTAEGARLAAENVWRVLGPVLEERAGALDAAQAGQ